jgi:hypothetical protein
MKTILIYLALFAFQNGTLNTLQDKPVVRLPIHQNYILAEYGGDEVLLKNSPPTIQLPQMPPQLDSHRLPWVVVVSNSGPGTVMIVGKALFSIRLTPGKSVGIMSTNTGYARVPNGN